MQREAPPNYIAGLGRGATGFTTQADLGNDFVVGDQFDDRPVFMTDYDREDEEADLIWESVEKKMQERRQKQKERKKEAEPKKEAIQEQFSDLKRGLSQMTQDDWMNIPEVGDLTRKKGKRDKKMDSYSAVPDSIVLGSMEKTVTSIDPTDGTQTNFAQFSQARNKVLGLKLDQTSDSVSGQTTVDPKGYLTGLGGLNIISSNDISDIKKARTLLKSMIASKPEYGAGWIAAARLEEKAQNLPAARDLMSQACEQCPKQEDVWLEAARLNNHQNAKLILASAVRELPQSVKIWLKAKDLETDARSQKKVLRRALEYVPNSIKLWKAAVECEEDPEDAKILLSRAVECVPLSVDLWLALARLETYQNAQKVLNKARTQIPTSHEIWLTAAKLEEQYGDKRKVRMIVQRAVQKLEANGSNLTRENWLKEAQSSEQEGFASVCESIVEFTIDQGLDDEDIEETLLEDCERSTPATTRAIYEYLVKKTPEKEHIWKGFAFFEKEHEGDLVQVVERAIEHCPQSHQLWLMLAKEKWKSSIEEAKQVLQRAFEANPSEEIWIAASKLEMESKNFTQAQQLLQQAREQSSTPRVWMKSVVLERVLKHNERALELVNGALNQFADFAKLWMLKSQILVDMNQLQEARETLSRAVKLHPKNTTIWIMASRLEEKETPIKARIVLEKARLMVQDQDVWVESIQVEERAGNESMAKVLIAKGLQQLPTAGKLWSLRILKEERPQRKARSADALKKCENDPFVLCTIARLFWQERKLDKARTWFQRAYKTNPDIGDTFAWWLKFESAHGDTKQVLEAFDKSEPKHGDLWQPIAKDLQNYFVLPQQLLQKLSKSLPN
ncbi:PRP1 splicing factor, N-terminal-domain-containing protein [Gorgonomyces haynaldii]|nr:PRP1 splicing factor, N-terminal-domain-containing protein [Gorgonomyces haynaldii]